MMKSILTRVLAALGGIVLCCMALCALVETFFQAPVTAGLSQLLGARSPLAVLLALLLAILLGACGVSSLLLLSPKRAAKKSGFVMQKGENGVIGVAVKSIEGLVQTCIRQHDTVHRAEIAVVERRDGIVILLNIQEAAGVNIPLAVGALQKQIKQYVSECTGVDVHEVRVMVENAEASVGASPYAVKEPVVLTTAVTAAELQREAAEMAVAAEEAAEPVEIALMPEVPAETIELALDVPVLEEIQEEEPAAAEIPAVPVIMSAPVVVPVMPEIVEEEDERPLHQRIFGTEEQPVFVPAPPELVMELAAEEAQEAPAFTEEAEAEDIPQAEAVEAEEDEFSVLEVVEAVSGEIAEEIAAADEIIAPVEAYVADEDDDADADEATKE